MCYILHTKSVLVLLICHTSFMNFIVNYLKCLKKGINVLITFATQLPKIAKKTYLRIVGIGLVSTIASIAVGTGIVSLISYLTPDTSHSTVNLKDIDLGSLTSVTEPLSSTALSPSVIGIIVVAFLVLFFITFATLASIVATLVHTMSFTQSIMFGLVRGFRSIPVQLLVGLLIFAGTIPGVLITTLAVLMFSTLNPIIGILFFIFGILLFLLPLLIMIKSVFVLFVWAEGKQKHAWSMVKRSFALVKGLVFWLLAFLILMLAVAGEIFNSSLVLSLNALSIAGPNVNIAVTHLTSIFFTLPFFYIIMYISYTHAKDQNSAEVKKST